MSLNYRNKKVNFFSNISGNKGIWENWNNFHRLQSDSIYDQTVVNISHNKSANIKTGADYFINDQHTIGIMFNGNFSSNDWTAAGETVISPQHSKLPGQILKYGNHQPSTRNNSNININYRFADTAGHELNIDADRGFFTNRGESLQPNLYTDANTGEVLRERIFANSTPINNYAGIIFNAEGGYDSRQARLTFQYRFGSSSVKAARDRKTSIESESGRL